MRKRVKSGENRNSQKLQNRGVGSVSEDKLTGRELRDMQRWTLYCREKLGSYEKLAEFIPNRKFGWLQHIGSGNFDKIRPTEWDYKFLHMAYQMLSREDVYLDLSLGLQRAVTQVFEYAGKIIQMSRGKG